MNIEFPNFVIGRYYKLIELKYGVGTEPEPKSVFMLAHSESVWVIDSKPEDLIKREKKTKKTVAPDTQSRDNDFGSEYLASGCCTIFWHKQHSLQESISGEQYFQGF